MKSRLSMILAGLALLASAGLASAGGVADQVMVSDAYTRAVPPGQPNSASFLTVINHSSQGAALVGASSSAAKVVELHNHTMNNGMMQMRRVDKIDLPAGGTVKLQPGGYHVMMIGLHKDLKPGDMVELKLVFADGSEKAVMAPVKKLQMKMGGMKPDMKHDMKHDMKKKM